MHATLKVGMGLAMTLLMQIFGQLNLSGITMLHILYCRSFSAAFIDEHVLVPMQLRCTRCYKLYVQYLHTCLLLLFEIFFLSFLLRVASATERTASKHRTATATLLVSIADDDQLSVADSAWF